MADEKDLEPAELRADLVRAQVTIDEKDGEIARLRAERDKFQAAWSAIQQRGDDADAYGQQHLMPQAWGENIWHAILDDAIQLRALPAALIAALRPIRDRLLRLANIGAGAKSAEDAANALIEGCTQLEGELSKLLPPAAVPTERREQLMKLPDIELVAANVHEAWMASKRAQGISTRRSESGEELMVPYANLSDAAKELDRGTVRAVYAAIAAASAVPPRAPEAQP